jgi:hypothetical protein
MGAVVDQTAGGSPGDAPVDWDAVHAAIQNILARMDSGLEESGLPIRSHAGRTAGNAFALFSYRSFDLQEGDDQDPVVVGITFVPGPDGVRVSGDMSHEETGQILYELDSQQVVASPAAVLAAAQDAATRLAAQAEVVGAAMSAGVRRRLVAGE